MHYLTAAWPVIVKVIPFVIIGLCFVLDRHNLDRKIKQMEKDIWSLRLKVHNLEFPLDKQSEFSKDN